MELTFSLPEFVVVKRTCLSFFASHNTIKALLNAIGNMLEAVAIKDKQTTNLQPQPDTTYGLRILATTVLIAMDETAHKEIAKAMSAEEVIQKNYEFNEAQYETKAVLLRNRFAAMAQWRDYWKLDWVIDKDDPRVDLHALYPKA